MIPEKIYCINLDRRMDRWRLAQEQFTKHDLTVVRFPGIDGRLITRRYQCDNSNNGCTLSHASVIHRAKLIGLKSVMIFEDDVVLHDEFRYQLLLSLQHLPDDWDMLYLGGSHRERPVKVNDHILRVTKTLTTHAYILRDTMYHLVIDNFKSFRQPVDCYYADWQKDHHVYITNPPLAWQRGGYSDIAGCEMYYDWIKSNEQ